MVWMRVMVIVWMRVRVDEVTGGSRHRRPLHSPSASQ
jgi:hypothetical protein